MVMCKSTFKELNNQYEEAKPYEKYRKRKQSIPNLIGGFTTLLVGINLLKSFKEFKTNNGKEIIF